MKHYHAAFNAPYVGHKDDESLARRYVDLWMKHDDNSGCGLTRVDLVLLPVANHHHRHHQLVHRRQFLCRETKKMCINRSDINRRTQRRKSSGASPIKSNQIILFAHKIQICFTRVHGLGKQGY